MESFRDVGGTMVPPGQGPIWGQAARDYDGIPSATQDRWRRRSCRLPMGEPAAAEPAGAGAVTSERDVLLAEWVRRELYDATWDG